ncbi:NAD-dependent epimerase/dehydratase family protein [Pyxidicoccus fallax]|uniref:NAD-dependent epimerase/dehydratase family protein n=1 Tax=Pyxidicoccus fallax TaxID=394095 RepID=A0A848LLY2_9BACT|nr:NAD-dependent epimerase/dehydratase family protein [Pyxidicoccus fallax]NMO18837.1 NAD-dependent epimerase/dehydratase family protein [Pyxidicoccus fallax]NPC84496.1 NAD-dependent epimerase/dehydratase family protein [Pyxidicoccus fallax]
MRVLIPGISGGIARKLALRLHEAGHQVAGIDIRPWEEAREVGIEVFRGDVRKRAAEDVFRRWRPEAVVHMATVTAFTVQGAERGRINLDGTKALFDHCAAHGVKQILFVGRHTFYGAAPDSPLYHSEDEPPRALEAIPELADLVAADLYAATALWRFPKLTTAVLRLPYTLGAPGTGTLASFIRGRRVPLVLGYDPLFHVLQEEDVVAALMLALEKGLRGIFNVAGPPPIPLSVIVRETGRTGIPLPAPALRLLLGRGGFPRLSVGALEHLRYPIVVDNRRFLEATGFEYQSSVADILRIYRESAPVPRS